MSRHDKHLAARKAVANLLRRRGLEVREAGYNAKYDLLVNRCQRVCLRVAFPGRYAHTVIVKGKRYAYDYRSWNFNFHRHGEWERNYCDIFVCIAKRRHGEDEVFVIPANAISGPTFSLHGAGKPYRGRYAAYRDAWDIFSLGGTPVSSSPAA